MRKDGCNCGEDYPEPLRLLTLPGVESYVSTEYLYLVERLVGKSTRFEVVRLWIDEEPTGRQPKFLLDFIPPHTEKDAPRPNYYSIAYKKSRRDSAFIVDEICEMDPNYSKIRRIKTEHDLAITDPTTVEGLLNLIKRFREYENSELNNALSIEEIRPSGLVPMHLMDQVLI